MTAKPKSTDANTREYWELAVRNSAEYGLTEEQVLAMKESLALTDPKYWKRVLKDPNSYGFSAEHAKNLAKKHAKTLAEHIDEQNQMTPEERIEAEARHHIGYYDSTHGKGHVQMWLEMGVVSPSDAAQLLQGENPTVFKSYDLGDVFGNMKKAFEDAARDGRDRNLRDWIAVARDRNLRGRCIDGWEACATVLTQDVSTQNRATTAPEVAAGKSDEATGTPTIAPSSDSGPCAVFRAMPNLRSNEVSIVISGTKDNSGELIPNNTLRITARGTTTKMTLSELGLIDIHRNIVNKAGGVLLGLAQRFRTSTAKKENIKRVERLRASLRTNLGLTDDPLPYINSKGWEPRFTIADSRGLADARAERDALSRTDSLEQLNARGKQFSAYDEYGDPIDPDADALLSQYPDDNR